MSLLIRNGRVVDPAGGTDARVQALALDEGLPQPVLSVPLGVAHAAGKKTIVVHSDQLDHAIWHRINAGVANPEYTELKFDETVKLIVDYCERNFV